MAASLTATNPTQAAQQKSNGVTLDPVLNNIQAVLVPSGARTVAPPIPTQVNTDARGIVLFLNVTASPANAAADLALSLSLVDPVSGTALVPAFTPTAIAATAVANAVTGIYGFILYPGLPSVAAATKNGAPATAPGGLPRVWSASVLPATADPWTFSLSYQLLS